MDVFYNLHLPKALSCDRPMLKPDTVTQIDANTDALKTSNSSHPTNSAGAATVGGLAAGRSWKDGTTNPGHCYFLTATDKLSDVHTHSL